MFWNSDELTAEEWENAQNKVTFAYNSEITNKTSVYAEICQQQMEESLTADNYEQYLRKIKILK